MAMNTGHGIGIHTHHQHAGKEALQFLLHLLGTQPHKAVNATALGAVLGQGLRIAAVVAHEATVGLVVGQVHRAPGAAGGLPALSAHHHLATAPPVDKEDGLFSPVYGLS